MHIESETSQSEIVAKLFACNFYYTIKSKRKFKLLLAIKEKEYQTKIRKDFGNNWAVK